MNVQHIESLNDVVAKVTGVVMRETVPDSIFEQADEVELIDLPPDDLLERFREGKVYVPGLAQEALENFFRKGNLIALRELSLRRTAERVDAQMRVYRREHAIASVWPTAERILVAIGPTPWSTRLVRAAKRMADQMGAEWIAAYVETPASLRLPAEAKDSVIQTLRLAESLGAQTITLSGQTMSEAILAYARDRNVTRIVVGKPTRKLWQRILMGSIVDALVQGSGDIDVQVISGAREEGVAPIRLSRRPLATDWLAYAWAGGIVGAATGAAWILFPFSELSNVVMLYLLAIVIAAMRTGRAPSLAASVLSVAAFDFFFVPPYLTFAVSDFRYVFTFLVMLAVGFVISGLTARTRAQAEGAQHREQETATLYAMSRELSSTRGGDNLLEIATRHVADVSRGRDRRPPARRGRPSGGGARRPVRRGRQRPWGRPLGLRAPPARRARHDDPPRRLRPLRAADRLVGPGGRARDPARRPTRDGRAGAPPPPRDVRRADRAGPRASPPRRGGATGRAPDRDGAPARSLLSSVSHDLRTPLAAIENVIPVSITSPSAFRYAPRYVYITPLGRPVVPDV